MKRGFWSGFGWSFCFPPLDVRFYGPWGRRPWGMGFPRREDYLHMLEQYKEELGEMQREITYADFARLAQPTVGEFAVQV